MPVRLHDAGLGASLFQLLRDPPRAAAELPVFVRTGGDGRHPEKLVQLSQQYFSRPVHSLSQVHVLTLLYAWDEVSTFAFSLRARAWSVPSLAGIFRSEATLWRKDRTATWSPVMEDTATRGGTPTISSGSRWTR